jgi:hypothetical protein
MSRTNRRPKARTRPPLALDGDNSGDITEILNDLPPWDGFTGASDLGVMGGSNVVWYSTPAAEPEPEPDEVPEPPPDAEPLFPPEPAAQAGTPVYDATVQGWGHLGVIRCAYACIAEHRDPAAGSFRALYEAARRAGWHRDAYGRDCCARCAQLSPEYRTPQPVTAWAYTDLQLQERTIAHWAASHARAGAHRQQVTR